MDPLDDYRAETVQGLWRLATLLNENPDIPTPSILEFTYHAHKGSDTANRSEVDRVAQILQVAPNETSNSEYYEAVRHFGPVSYRALAITAHRMRLWRALMSYSDSVQPEVEDGTR